MAISTDLNRLSTNVSNLLPADVSRDSLSPRAPGPAESMVTPETRS